MAIKVLSSLIVLFIFCCGYAHSQAIAADQIRLVFYFGPSANPSTTAYTFDTFPEILSHTNFRRERHTVIFHYENFQSATNADVLDIMRSYLLNENFNFVLMDYTSPMLINEGNIFSISALLSTSLNSLFSQTYSSGFMHLVGFGTGANIFGTAARNLRIQTTHTIGRITGLSPTNVATNLRLAPLDAQFVDTVHTEATSVNTLGIVRFFINGDANSWTNQPTCMNVNCNRVFAMRLYAESVRSRFPLFPALLCDNWANFVSGSCNDRTPIGHMGKSANVYLRDNYFVRTNNASPWSRNNPFP